METALEWLSIRVQHGWSLPGLDHRHDGDAVTQPSSTSEALPTREGGAAAGTKRESSEECTAPVKKARRL